MATIFGKNYTRQELLQKTGTIQQIGGITPFEYTDGRAAHTRALMLDTGVLSLILLPSRCLDIAFASYKGIPISYLSKSGIRNPQYFSENGSKGFLDNFFGGLLTTSGLNSIGSPSSIGRRGYGLHGEISNIPAESVSVSQDWEQDDLIFTVKAVMRQSRFYGEDRLFTRELRTSLGSHKILLRDTVENLDFTPAPVFLLYHINFGFPLVDEHAYLTTAEIEKVIPRTASAAAGTAAAGTMEAPAPMREEECFYYYFKERDVKISITNPSLGPSGLSAYIKYSTAQFPEFVEWKLMRSREYVCGFAPSTNRLEGREQALANETVRYLKPLEKITFQTEIGVEE